MGLTARAREITLANSHNDPMLDMGLMCDIEQALRDVHNAAVRAATIAVAAQEVIMGRSDTGPRMEELRNAVKVISALFLPSPGERKKEGE